MGEPPDDFKQLLELLIRRNVKFILVGGLACALNGYVRTTEDVDIIIEPSPDNVVRLLDALKGWGEGYAGELTVEDFSLEPGAIRIVENFPLDIFTLLGGHPYADFVGESATSQDGIPYLKTPALIRLKSESLRPKDQIDVSELRSLS